MEQQQYAKVAQLENIHQKVQPLPALVVLQELTQQQLDHMRTVYLAPVENMLVLMDYPLASIARLENMQQLMHYLLV
jgi:hypothetical protein